MNRRDDNHLSARQLQALLEGELPKRDLGRAEEHLATCARCSSELSTWRLLFEDLGAVRSHRPHEGFADRVMAAVHVPEPDSLSERVLGRLSGLAGTADDHVVEGALQDFLEGTLAGRRAQRIEAHLEGCASCSADADAWLDVMRRLDGLERFAPADGFADRVMSAVELPERTPMAVRMRDRLGALLGTPNPKGIPEHPPQGILQDFVDGVLPGPATARVRAHLGDCLDCANEVHAWEGLVARLDAVDRLAPSAGFSDRVVANLHGAKALARPPVWSRALAAASRAIPQTREAWAALSGVAVTPAVVTGLVLYAVFSHPTLTLGSLLSFAWWQLTDLVGTALTALANVAVQSSEAFGLYSLFETLASAPAMVAGGILAYSAFCALALRVLYKNLLANRSNDGRHAHASHAP